MKTLRAGLIAVSAFWALSAHAQWQVPNNTIPVGKGQGVVGFGSVANDGSGTGCLTNTAPPTFVPCSGGSSVAKQYYVTTSGSDANNGLSWSTAKLTIAAAITAAGSNSQINIGSGTYTLTASLATVADNSAIVCTPGAIITQAAAANLATLLSVGGNFFAVRNCIFDGARATNTDNSNNTLLINTGADISIENSVFRNSTGQGIFNFGGVRPNIRKNQLSNLYASAIVVTSPTINLQSFGSVTDNEILTPFRIGIYIVNSDFMVVHSNRIVGTLAGAPGNLLRVDTNGTAVAWVSGPQFTSANNIYAGQFIVLNGGTEALITQVNSATSLTIDTNVGVLANVLAAIGPGDLLSIDSAAFSNIYGNNLTGGVTGGIVVSDASLTGEIVEKNNVFGNTIAGSGTACLSISQSVALKVRDNVLSNNIIRNCGRSGAAAAAAVLVGIYVVGTPTNTLISSNLVKDDQGAPTMSHWLNNAGAAAGEVKVGFNTSVGPTNGTNVAGTTPIYPNIAGNTFTNIQLFNSGTLAYVGATSGLTTLNASAVASGTLTLPAATDTLVGKATTDVLTNKTFDTAGAGNSLQINSVAVTANTGTGAVARATSPTFLTTANLNANSTGLLSPPAGTIMQIAGADGVQPRLVIDAFGTGTAPVFNGRRARNTAASPQAVQADDRLISVAGIGYEGTTPGYSSAARTNILGLASETWTSTQQGAYVSVFTTPIAGTATAEALRVNPSGGLSVGTTTDSGIGAVLANTSLTATTYVKTGVTTVGALPACGAGTKGARLFVTDSNAASFTAGIGAVVAAGGATNVPVTCDGTNWRIG